MTIVAMTREMGTRGKDVAGFLVDRLDLRVVHPELVETPAERDEAPAGSEVHRFLNGGEDDSRSAAGPGGNGYMTPDEVLTLASRGNVVIRGWGSARLLHAIPHIICVRVCAPIEDRIAEMKKRLGVDEDVAHREILRSDAAHAGAFERFFGADWRDPLNYDLVLNTAHLSPEACADIIVEAAKSPAFQETDASRRALADRLAESQITSLLKIDDAIKARARNVYVAVADGVVSLFGAARDQGAARDIESAIRAKIGCERIQNTIQTTGALHSTSG